LWSSMAVKRTWNVPNSWMGSLVLHSRDPSGQYYRRNRYYDPESGRFTQEDPIGLAGGLNLYGYANGDPINFSDPFGLRAQGCCRDRLPGTHTADQLVAMGDRGRLDDALAAARQWVRDRFSVSVTGGNATATCSGDGCNAAVEINIPQRGASIGYDVFRWGDSDAGSVSVNFPNRHLGVSVGTNGLTANLGLGSPSSPVSVTVSAPTSEQGSEVRMPPDTMQQDATAWPTRRP
jgi:RHS repeat-associated protein